MATVLFVCLQNAGRSQMSQALFERAAGGAHRALSAGTTPPRRIHPEVVQVMHELQASNRPPSISFSVRRALGRNGSPSRLSLAL